MTESKLMLDEMFSPRIAAELVERGHDVLAVAGESILAGAPDEQILRAATTDGRALLTENVRDFEILRTTWLREGRACAGLLYTNRQRFPREAKWAGRLVVALDERFATGTLPAMGHVDWLVWPAS